MTSWKGLLRVATVFCYLLLPTTQAQVEPSGHRLGPGREFERITIPGAKCGDGSPYAVFFSKGSTSQLAFNIMYGGACWDSASCFGLPLTWIHPFPMILEQFLGGMLSSSPAQSPLTEHSLVYFPYCTGDVHTGTHTAVYSGQRMHHTGRTNFEAAIETLVSRQLVRPELVRNFVLFGSSAGALGSLYHLRKLDQLFKNAEQKTVLSDAPGLHFGTQFWNKFTPELISDFKSALRESGYALRRGSGNIAALIPTLCQQFPNWNIGVLQGAQDVVMSRVFGELNPKEHRQLVYGREGLYELAQRGGSNCSVWIPDTPMHTFLVAAESAILKTSDGTTAMDFVRALLKGHGGLTFR